MKTILATAYAINPYKGSEDGTGWNYILQIARLNKVIAITRKNNRSFIEKYLNENPDERYRNMHFEYYDLPYWMRFWKRGGKGAMLYYYLWQLFMPIFIKKKKLNFDIAHNLNFHNDWTPTMLWMTGKPVIWGPVGHHPSIPKQFLLPIYGLKAYLKDRRLWILKNIFWNLDPMLRLSVAKADIILAMNSSVPKVLRTKQSKIRMIKSVSSENVELSNKNKTVFNILSVGRFVPLKGFDLTIRSFASFYKGLANDDQQKVKLILVGDGPELPLLEKIILEENIFEAIQIIHWLERSKLTEIYRDASVFLFPSHEGAGMVVPEALSYSLPVVCLANYGPGEFVTDECGIRVEAKEYSKTIIDLADALNKLFENTELYAEMALQARKHFDEYFDWNVKAKILNDFYEEICLKNE